MIKYILILLILQAISSQVQCQYTPLSDCSELEGQWYGLTFRTQSQICFYNMNMSSLATKQNFQMETYLNPIFDGDEGKLQGCHNYKNKLVFGQCPQNTGLIEFNYQNAQTFYERYKFQGQGNENYVLAQDVMEKIVLVNINSEDKFSQNVNKMKTLEEKDDLQWIIPVRPDLIYGKWEGKYLQQNKDDENNSNCLYDTTIEIQVEGEYSKYSIFNNNGQYAGENQKSNKNYCENQQTNLVGISGKEAHIINSATDDDFTAIFKKNFMMISQENGTYVIFKNSQ